MRDSPGHMRLLPQTLERGNQPKSRHNKVLDSERNLHAPTTAPEVLATSDRIAGHRDPSSVQGMRHCRQTPDLAVGPQPAGPGAWNARR
eukprot:60050-Pyramimonas_sp.AAC.1